MEQMDEKIKKHAEDKLKDSCQDCELAKSELQKVKYQLD